MLFFGKLTIGEAINASPYTGFSSNGLSLMRSNGFGFGEGYFDGIPSLLIDNRDRLFHVYGGFIVMNEYSDEETNALTRLKDYYNDLTQYRRELVDHRNNKSRLMKIFGMSNDSTFKGKEPKKPTGILIVKVEEDHLEHINEEDVDLIRFAYHKRILRTDSFREGFLKMLNERVDNNIMNVFAQRGSPQITEMTKTPVNKINPSIKFKKDLEQEWENKLASLEREVSHQD